MSEEFDYAGFAARVRQLASDGMAEAGAGTALVQMMESVTGYAEGELERCLGDGGKHIACRAGCSTCCAVNVSVLFPEGVAIVDFLQREKGADELRRIRERLDELYREVRWLDDSERPFIRRSCAFLDEGGSCSIYPVRPLICRSVTSTDPERCKEALVAPVFGEEVPVLMNLFQKTLFERAFTALGEAIEAADRDARGSTLTVTVKRLLDDPGLVEKFWRGEAPY
jgi:Fe-S-cluster containining protein